MPRCSCNVEVLQSVPVCWILFVQALRTTKRQIYRNWGQRMLSAFYRTKTKPLFWTLNLSEGTPAYRQVCLDAVYLCICEARSRMFWWIPAMTQGFHSHLIHLTPLIPRTQDIPKTPWISCTPYKWPRFGFASLHNVNEPSKPRDDMPSFFVAVPRRSRRTHLSNPMSWWVELMIFPRKPWSIYSCNLMAQSFVHVCTLYRFFFCLDSLVM